MQETYDKDDFKFNKENEPLATVARSWENFAILGSSGEDDLPKSILSQWEMQRKFDLDGEKINALNRLKPFNDSYASVQDLEDAAVSQAGTKAFAPGELEAYAAAETGTHFENPLDCGPYSLALIRSRWELAASDREGSEGVSYVQ